MSSLPLPPKQTTSRELLSLARRIERYGAQRRKLLARVDDLDGQVRECKRMFRSLTELIAGSELPQLASDLCGHCRRPYREHGGAEMRECDAALNVAP